MFGNLDAQNFVSFFDTLSLNFEYFLDFLLIRHILWVRETVSNFCTDAGKGSFDENHDQKEEDENRIVIAADGQKHGKWDVDEHSDCVEIVNCSEHSN